MHPTQVFLSNPKALRAEFRMDDAQLELWWSPKAGESYDCHDRYYSSRDAHLNVFEKIEFEGCDLASFESCDYDPYHCVLHFKEQTLHLAIAADSPTVLVWAEQPQRVSFETHRFDRALGQTPQEFLVSHEEPRYTFEFVARLGEGAGAFEHCNFHGENFPYFVSAALSPGQPLAIGVGLAGEDIATTAVSVASAGAERFLQSIDDRLAPVEAVGRIVSKAHPELADLRQGVVRGLHSLIDESGCMRASLKPIYYLIWVRDAGFSFPYQSASGWPHRLAEATRAILENPTRGSADSLKGRRVFGQLIHRNYGKLEEDGAYYAIWMLFTQWTQFGSLDGVTESDWELIDEALSWVEDVTWDAGRGLYGEHFADETPTLGSRDSGWDYAIGQQAASAGGMTYEGKPVTENYDVYFNIIMHSAYTMLAALRGDTRYQEKADRVWPELKRLLDTRKDGVPIYGEQKLEDGTIVTSHHWGQARSCCIWGLTMPNFAPLDDWDEVLAATMDAIIREPEMHWINGICGAIAAMDTWFYPEAKLLDLLNRVVEDTNRPGKFLPMGGAMPEKLNAPEGNLYHDIRPQGFAMGAFLAACSGLGVRRLPHGLALRPTAAYERIENFAWRGVCLDFELTSTGRQVGVEIDERLVPRCLQLPQSWIEKPGRQGVRLVEVKDTPLWLRSTVQLDDAERAENGYAYRFTGYGLSQIVLEHGSEVSALLESDGRPVEYRVAENRLAKLLHFECRGSAVLTVRA